MAELGLQEARNMSESICRNKYVLNNSEKSLDDVLLRVSTIIKEKGLELGYPEEDVLAAAKLIVDKKFIPGGSILYGLGRTDSKCSLSNCYVIPIEEDSIEGIGKLITNIMRTYSYRGGCGTDLTILRPTGDPVSNSAKNSSGAVSFMPMISMITETIGQCLKYNSLVITKEGLTEIKDVKTGDEVWTRKGFVKVVGVHKSHKKVYTLVSPYNTISASEDHVFVKVTIDGSEIEQPLSEFRAFRDTNNDSSNIESVLMQSGDIVESPNINIKHYFTSTEDIARIRSDKLRKSIITFMACESNESPLCIREYCNTSNETGDGTFSAPIIDIYEDPDGEVDTYDLQLEEEHLFWCNGFYVHNCGRRGAIMMTMDVRHPDIEQFIWCKADPERVFPKDVMNADRLPTVNGANISVKITDEFMNAVQKNELWYCIFPDIQADKEFYNKHWKGDYGDWIKRGGKIKKYYSYPYIVTKNTRSNLVGRMKEEVSGTWDDYTGPRLRFTQEEVDLIPENTVVRVMYGYAKDVLNDIAHASWLRADPGVMFIDICNENTPCTHINDKYKIISSNPCGEIIASAYSNCNLGAHVLSKYVQDPWTNRSHFNIGAFVSACKAAVIIQDIVVSINTELHPLQEQRKQDKESRRLGIEFTGLGDTLSMLGLEYSSDKAREFVSSILVQKNIYELYSSSMLAEKLGCCSAMSTMKSRIDYLNTKFIKNIFEYAQKIQSIYITKPFVDLVCEKIKTNGLRNLALNTVGPTGSLSILANNCSSGIEPIFSLAYERTTRVGGVQSYTMVHPPVLEHILHNHKNKLIDGYNIKDIKKDYCVQEAHEVSPIDRINMQACIQRFIDHSISSTINLPSNTTVDDIIYIYEQAWVNNLKGITIYRDSCMSGVLNTVKENTNNDITTGSIEGTIQIPHNEINNSAKLLALNDIEKADRHRVVWNGAKIYVIVTIDTNGAPIEIFAKLPREIGIDKDGNFNEQSFQEKFSLFEVITRLVSVSLRGGVSIYEIIKQLKKSTYVVNDCIAVLTRVLMKYLPCDDSKHELSKKELINSDYTQDCPICGEKTYIFTGGCGQCYSCGYSKCV